MQGFRRLGGAALAFAFVFSLGASAPAVAQNDPAAATVEALDSHLLSVMKDAKALGFKGRYTRLKPAVEAALDLPTMTRYAVGPSWASMTEAQHAALTAAFSRMVISTYAHNFDGYSGEKFVTDRVDARGAYKLVHTQIVQGNGKKVSLVYQMHQVGAGWKVVDVLYMGAISELTTRRSDFSGTLAKGGEPALLEHLNALSDKLAR
jgi:phospholipid transport system substrate-binding protein